MKSKMKSTFAIIAVALMVLVAVVPMVGVFTSSSDAAVPSTDPKIENKDKITIKGHVYTAVGGDYAGYVVITWGPTGNEYSSVVTALTSGAYAITLTEKQASKLKVTVVDADGVAVSGFDPYTFEDTLTSGTYTANIVSKDAAAVSVALMTGTSAKFTAKFPEAVWSDLVANGYIKVHYGIYTTNDASDTAIKTGLSDLGLAATQSSSTSAFTITYPASYSAVYVKVDYVLVKLGADYDEYTLNVITDVKAAGTALTWQNKEFTFTMPNKDIPDATLGNLSVTGSAAISNFEPFLGSYVVGKNTSTLFIYSGTDVKSISGKITWSSAKQVEDTFTKSEETAFTSYTYALPTTGVYYGTLTIDVNVPIYDGQALVMSYGTTSYTRIDKMYVADGCYIAIPGNAEATPLKMDQSTYKYSTVGGKSLNSDGVTIEGNNPVAIPFGAANVVIDINDYYKVQVNVLDGNSAALSAPVSLTVSGFADQSYVLGYAVSSGKITISASSTDAYLFVKKNTEITFQPSAGEVFTLLNDATHNTTFVINAAKTGSDKLVLTMDKSAIKFKATDADGNAITNAGDATLTLYYPKTSAIYDAINGTQVGTTGIYYTAMNYDGATYKTWSIAVNKSYYDLTGAEFYLVSSNNTFANDALNMDNYEPGTSGYMTVSSLDAKYSVYMKDTDGVVILDKEIVTATEALVGYVPCATVTIYNVYKTESGNKVLTATGTTYTVSADSTGKMTVRLPSTYVNVDVGSSVKKVAIVEYKVATPSSASNSIVRVSGFANPVFEDYYIMTTDATDGKVVTITAKLDALEGIAKKTNGTILKGALVELYKATDLVGTAVSGDDGKFKINSDFKIVSAQTFKVKITVGGVDLTSGGIFVFPDDSGKTRNTDFKTILDMFYFTVEDANEVVYVPTLSAEANKSDVLTFKEATTATIGGFYKALELKAGEIVQPTLKTGSSATQANETLRTFGDYTVKDADITSGVIALTTNQNLYTIGFEDALGFVLPVQAGDLAFFNYASGEYKDGVTTYDKRTSVGGYTYTVAVDNFAAPYTAQYVSLTVAGTAAVYGFDGTKFLLDDEETTMIESTSTICVVPVVDYDGNVLTIDTAVPKVDTVAAKLTIDGKLKFIADLSKDGFTIDWNGCKVKDATGAEGYFTTTAGQEYPLGVSDLAIVSTKARYTISVTDAIGKVIANAEEANVKFIGYKSVLDTGTIIANIAIEDGVGSKIATADDYIAYGLEVNNAAYAKYSFPVSETTDFKANEQMVKFTYSLANGAAFDIFNAAAADTYELAAYDIDGEMIAVSAVNSLIVDVSEAALYGATLTKDGVSYDFAGLTTDVITSYTKITGSLPVAADSANDYVLIQKCLEGKVVGTQKAADLAQGSTTYTAYVDVGDMIDETAGVAFDSLVATYVYKGAVYATVAVDPTSVFNPIVTPGSAVIQYVAVLVPPSAVIADHVGYAQVGNTVTVTADANFFVADDESIYTDGQYKYVFAGWYVDNEKVSANPVFTFTMTEDVVISPQYTVTYEKTSDVNKDVEKEYVNIVEKVEVPVEKTVGIDTNVLIIGICAVIVALIAVVYAVIKKE